MRYEIKSAEVVKQLSGDLSLFDEIALARWTIQDLVSMLEIQQPAQRIAVGSMLRDALEMLSRMIERASKLPQQGDTVPVARVMGMLRSIEDSIKFQLPEGSTQQQLIMSIKEHLEGISIREEPSALVLRTCEMMDNSVPRIEE